MIQNLHAQADERSSIAYQALRKHFGHGGAKVIRNALVCYFYQTFGVMPVGRSYEDARPPPKHPRRKKALLSERRRVYQIAYSLAYRYHKKKLIRERGATALNANRKDIRAKARRAGREAMKKYDSSEAECEGCYKPRRDLRLVGEIALCFLCRVEASRGRLYNLEQQRYLSSVTRL